MEINRYDQDLGRHSSHFPLLARSHQHATVMAIKQVGKSTDMTLEEFEQWLKQFDADNDGRISKEELRRAIRSLGVRFSRWKCYPAMRRADSDGSGFVEEDEFENLVAFAQRSLGLRIVA